MTVYGSSGLAEVIGYLLILFVGPLLGAAVSAIATAAVTTLAVLSAVHGLGLGIALGSHRLDRSGHWIVRPLLFSAAFAVLSIGSLTSNAVLIVATLMVEEVSWWTLAAPASALIVQIASGVIAALWAIDRVVRLLGDYASQAGIGDGERAGVWWRRLKIGTRWSSTAVWVLAGLALVGGSLLGLVITIPLLAIAEGGVVGALVVHALLMLVGAVAGGVVTVTRIAMLRRGRESSREWNARLRGEPRESFLGRLWRVVLSLTGWLLGELVLWLACTGVVAFALSVVAAVLDPEVGPLTVLLGALVLPIALGGLWLSRTGGPLRALVPSADLSPRSGASTP